MDRGLAIDFVSPLPPVRSGIADYSLDLLPHLAALADLRLVRLPGQPVSEGVVERWSPVAADETGRDGRLPLYQMGNNRYHEGVLRLALERAGVLTLHDVVLHHLLVESTLGHAQLEPYMERLAADHGWMGELAARARQWGELGQAALFGLPANRTLLRRQRGVLVHSRWAAEQLREEDPEIQVRVVPMGVPLPPPVDEEMRAAFRGRLGLAQDQVLLGSFGFQTPIKRTDRLIASLARPEMAEIHLVVGGEISPSLRLQEMAREAGVADRVHFVGFLDAEGFRAAIAAADICANLRYPTAGETSASLLRVLAVGRPVLVSDYAQSADLPDEVALKIPLGRDEIEGLAAAVPRLASAPELRRRLAGAAREYVRRVHDPGRAATAVVESCAELSELPPPGDLPASREAPTTLVWHHVPGSLEVIGADPPWPEGEARSLRLRLENTGSARWLATRHRIGGVLLEVHWRKSPWHPPMDPVWLEIEPDLQPGESRELETRLRRPIGSLMLVVEPHVKGIAGFNVLGGPSWERTIPTVAG